MTEERAYSHPIRRFFLNLPGKWAYRLGEFFYATGLRLCGLAGSCDAYADNWGASETYVKGEN